MKDYLRADLSHSRFEEVDFSQSRFHNVYFQDTVIRGAWLQRVEIDGYIDDVTINGVDIGPLIDDDAVAKVKRLVDDAIAKGARVLHGAFEQVLGTYVQRLATIAHGDGVCTTHVPLPVPLPASATQPSAAVSGRTR